MIRISTCIAALALSGCATAPIGEAPVRTDGMAAIGQATQVGRLVVTPQALIEDSRCPADVQCVWAGRLVLRTRIEGAGWRETRDLVLGEPQAVRDGRVTLSSARPGKRAGAEVPPAAYLFGFSR